MSDWVIFWQLVLLYPMWRLGGWCWRQYGRWKASRIAPADDEERDRPWPFRR